MYEGGWWWGRTWSNFTEYSDSATVLFFFGIAKQRVSYVVPVELRSVCEELCRSVASRHSSYTYKNTRAFVQEKMLQYICFWFVLSSRNKKSRADLIRLIFHYFRYTGSRNWGICLIVGRTFQYMLAKSVFLLSVVVLQLYSHRDHL